MTSEQLKMKKMRIMRHTLMAGLVIMGLVPPALAQTPTQETPPAAPVKFLVPRLADIPDDANGKQILYGRRLVMETARLLPSNVGDVLNCTSCHLGGGTVAGASPFIGQSSASYPRDNPRAGHKVTLEDRINGCFQRSMNGKPLANDSAEMKAMVAYFNWLSADVPPHAKVEGAGIGKIDKTLVPDAAHGKELYGTKCAVCHGTDGQGLKNAKGEFVFPPLWGDRSFNVGAGMARTYTAAAFIKRNMPIGYGLNGPLGQGGALTEQEAVDVAEYFSHQPRPDFPAKVNDWPNGGKPKDARY